MYTLADYIGEDKVNAALKKFLEEYKFANASDGKTLRTRTRANSWPRCANKLPRTMQYLITDMFESIVLYDNKALNATVFPRQTTNSR